MFKQSFFVIFFLLLTIACSEDTNETKKSPKVDLLTAVANANIDIIKEHIALGTDINEVFVETKDWNGAGALHIAVISPTNAESIMKYKTVVELLLSGGANIEIKARNPDEATPLSWATYFGKLEMVEFLVDRGANVNLTDKHGNTPLDAARLSPFMGSELNRSAIISFLRNKGAKTKDD